VAAPTTDPAGPRGWAFLVAAGRRRDYAILLAPDFLVADLDYGVLDRVARPAVGPGPAEVVDVSTGHGRRLTVVSATHLLTAADLTDVTAGNRTVADVTAADSGAGHPGADPRDEHGRPLRLVYGFVTADVRVVAPAAADLGHARAVALAAYRRFLVDEDQLAVRPAAAFGLRSATVARNNHPPVPARARPTAAAADPARRRRWVVGLAVSAALVAGFGAGTGALVASRPGAPVPQPDRCATSPAVPPSPSPTPDCPSGSQPGSGTGTGTRHRGN
jgi:hypothetical protein